jgi:exodeoxyribonuclease VII small subunit
MDLLVAEGLQGRLDYHWGLTPAHPGMPPPDPPANLTFEKAVEELEALVARMEDGRLPLEESLAAYQRGAELIKFCEGRLSDAQARIAVLEGGELRDLPPPK